MSEIMRMAPPAARTRTARGDAHAPSLFDFVEGALGAIDGMVIGATIFPGVLLCVPAILFVVAPLVLIGALVALVALILAAPVLLAVGAGRLLARRRARAAAAPATPAVAPTPERAARGGVLVLAHGGEHDG